MTIECYIKECPYHSIHDRSDQEGPYCFERTCQSKRLTNAVSQPRPRVLIENNKAAVHYAAPNPYQDRYHTLCGILQTVSSQVTALEVTCQTCINIDVQLGGTTGPISIDAVVEDITGIIPIITGIPAAQKYQVRYKWQFNNDGKTLEATCYFDATSIGDAFKQFMALYNASNPLASITIKRLEYS
jgi:hypothetical protein